ncbi:MAG: hypothetical protein ABIS50_22615, partial [Luteolibacter sp.]
MRLRVATPNVLGHPAARGKPEFNKVAYRRRMRRLVCAQHGHDVNRLNNRAKLAWTEKAHHRFKERIKEITSRNRGHNVQTVIGEL